MSYDHTNRKLLRCSLQGKSEDRPVHTLVGQEQANRSDTCCYCRWRSQFASDTGSI